MYSDFADRTGVDAISIDHTVPVDWAAEVLQPICTVQGNLDNHLLVVGGEVMKYEVEKILATLGQGPFIFNLGHGLLPETNPDGDWIPHVDMGDLVDQYNEYLTSGESDDWWGSLHNDTHPEDCTDCIDINIWMDEDENCLYHGEGVDCIPSAAMRPSPAPGRKPGWRGSSERSHSWQFLRR